MADEKFKLPGSSYDELSKIIIAYAHAAGKSSNADISKRTGSDPTTVSRNGGFLVETGIVTKGQKKEVTEIGQKLARAIEHDIPDEISASWREVVQDISFFETILSAVRIRKGMDSETLKTHVSYTAGLPKAKGSSTRSLCIVEILKASRLIEETDGLLMAVPIDGVIAEIQKTNQSSSEANVTIKGSGKYVNVQSPRLSINVDVQIRCKPSEVDGLGEKLRDMIDAIENKSAKELEE